MLSILFAGSNDEKSEKHPAFMKLCHSIGFAVTKRHRVLVLGTTPRTADHSVAAGAFAFHETHGQDSTKRDRIRLYKTGGDETSESPNEVSQRFKVHDGQLAKIEPFPDGSYEAAFKQAIADCDVVVIVGGEDGTSRVADISIDNQKPVLGFTAFGGAGATINKELQRLYQLLGISHAAYSTLNLAEIDEKTEGKFLELIECAHQRNPWAKGRFTKGLTLSAGLLVALAGLWTWMFIQATTGGLPPWGKQYHWVIPLCVAAGLVGGLANFLITCREPGPILLQNAFGLSARGLVTGLSIAFFSVLVVGSIVRDGGSTGLSFEGVFAISSLVSALAGAVGIKSLEHIEHLLHRVPH